MTIQRPRFVEHTRIHTLHSGVYFVSDHSVRVVRGKAPVAVCAWIDGHRTSDDIVELASGAAPYHELYHAINRLEAAGLICEASVPTSNSALLAGLRAIAGFFPDPRNRARVAVVNCTALAADTIERELTAAGWSVVASPDEADIAIVIVDDYLDPELRQINNAMLAAGRPWLLARLNGAVVRVGPLFGISGCWKCLEHRLLGTDPIYRMHQYQNLTYAPAHLVPDGLSARIGATLIAARLFSALAELTHNPLGNAILCLDTVTLKTSQHPFTRMPQCPLCGDPALMRRDTMPSIDIVRAKQFPGWRLLDEGAMLERVQPFYDDLTGIIMSVGQDSANLDVPGVVHIFTAKHPHKMNRAIPDIAELYYMCSGKATTPPGAKLACICEGIERYSALYQGDEQLIEASYHELQHNHDVPVLHPNEIMLYSESQFANRRTLNVGTSAYNYVPTPLEPRKPIMWAPVWQFSRMPATNERQAYVPAAILHFGMDAKHARFTPSNSNGLSTGGCLEEAALHGFFEVFERDAIAIWWYNRLQRPRLVLEDLCDPFVERVIAYSASLERELWVLDTTNDLGIPTYAAISARKQDGRHIVYGFGCHFDPRRALHAALLEMLQCLPIVFKWEGNQALNFAFPEELQRWLSEASLDTCDYLLPNGEARSIARYATPESTIGHGLEACLQIVESAGLTAYVAELTRPEIGIAVAKIIVPGLRIFWNRFAPGRLYDVPVQLGWLHHPRAEHDLNPYSVFF
jgi:oxazoline/thiazoline synthase